MYEYILSKLDLAINFSAYLSTKYIAVPILTKLQSQDLRKETGFLG